MELRGQLHAPVEGVKLSVISQTLILVVVVQVEVFSVVMPCSVAVGYHCFRIPCCLHLQVEVHFNTYLASMLS